MGRFLVTLSLGPVQSLIDAARRTRDLWCGSWLLSEAARAAARVLDERQPGCLIFPCPEDPAADLRPQDRPADKANFANIIRAEVALPNEEAVRVLCADAKAAAVSQIVSIGDRARNEIAPQGSDLREDVWLSQIDDILEIYSAWTRIPAGQGYSRASQRLGGVLAARKATRDFAACKLLQGNVGLPKSSLDGARETVLPKCRQKGDWLRRKLQLSDGEQLDALGFLKRMAGDSDQFTAYARIAADPWIESLLVSQQEALRDAYEPLVKLRLATRTRGNDGIYKAMPFDAMLLYSSRLDNALSRARKEGNEEEEGALCNLQQSIKRLSENAPARAPVPYAAILKADGDRMGTLLSKADTVDQAREISSTLHGFASAARKIVREHRGHAVYAGGDDVLAFLPLSRAMECSKALARSFANCLDKCAREMGVAASERPSLSVGLGIGHVMEPMVELRTRSARAEKTAKGDATANPRNALAVVLGIRSGAEVCWRARWEDTGAFNALSRMSHAFRQGALPTRVAYDIRAIDRRLAWLRGDGSERARGMREAEVGRMLKRARVGGGADPVPGDLVDLIASLAKAQPLKDLAETLIIARWLSARTESDLGERS